MDVKRRRDELARTRKALGMTQEELAEKVGVSVDTIARLEQGATSEPLAKLRPALMRELHLKPLELDRMIANHDGATPPSPQAVRGRLSWFANLEQGSAQIHTFEPLTVHALLQTRAYAAAVEASAVTPSEEAIAEFVEIRMARRRLLTREDNPAELFLVLDESVLYRVAGGRQVMVDQLDRLVEMSERPNIQLCVLPFHAGMHAPAGSFTVFTPADPSQCRMTCIEHQTGFVYLDAVDVADAHLALHQHLCDAALSPHESIDLIRSVAKERYE